jgi:hypothetical protein
MLGSNNIAPYEGKEKWWACIDLEWGIKTYVKVELKHFLGATEKNIENVIKDI